TAIELERLDADARQERAQRDLERARAGFLTAMTHDLRTPLATIKTATGALLAPQGRLDASERRELLQDTYSEAAHLERLVDKVLQLARIRGGALALDRELIAPVDLVQAVTTRWSGALRGREIHLDLDPDLPAVPVDTLLMEHVLVNLLENAAIHGGS